MLSRTQLEIRVRYNAPVTDSRRVLRVLPSLRETQTILIEQWATEPKDDFALEKADELGNRRLLLRHRRLEAEFRFGLEFLAETEITPLPEAHPDFARWKMPSRAVVLTPELQNVAREARGMEAQERARHFARFCESRLKYQPEPNPRPQNSEKLWQRGIGNCADFSHVLLSLCRSSGLPARYVAGFNATQGQMHAWAEIWCGGYWHALDPTLGREISPGSVTVAIGRDFYDCAPHTGSYRGAGGAAIELWCRTELKTQANS